MPMTPEGYVKLKPEFDADACARQIEEQNRRAKQNAMNAPKVEVTWPESEPTRSYSVPSAAPQKYKAREVRQEDSYDKVLAYAFENPEASPNMIASALGAKRSVVLAALKALDRT